jgi:hypothetical protein
MAEEEITRKTAKTDNARTVDHFAIRIFMGSFVLEDLASNTAPFP